MRQLSTVLLPTHTHSHACKGTIIFPPAHSGPPHIPGNGQVQVESFVKWMQSLPQHTFVREQAQHKWVTFNKNHTQYTTGPEQLRNNCVLLLLLLLTNQQKHMGALHAIMDIASQQVQLW